MVSTFLKVLLAAVLMQGLLHLRPDYPAIEPELKKSLGLGEDLLTFELSIAEFYPLTLGILALSVSSSGPLTPWGLGFSGSVLVVIGEKVFLEGVAWSSIPLLFVGRLVFAVGEVFAQDVALIPLLMEHFTAADTTIIYAATIAGSYFGRAVGLEAYRWLHDDYGLDFLGTLTFFWLSLFLYPALYVTMRKMLPDEERFEHELVKTKSKSSVLNTVLDALRSQRELPWYFWFMLTGAALFNASSLLYDDFILLPEVFDDVNTQNKAWSVMVAGYNLLGVACLVVTWLYYREIVTDENPRLTAKLLFLLLGLRLAGFIYMGARLLFFGRQVSKYWVEVSVEVLVHLGTFLFDMWAEPHLVSLAGRERTSEACVMGLLTFLTAVFALPLVHLQEELFLWHADSNIAVQVVALSVVFFFMFLVWKGTPKKDDVALPHPTNHHVTSLSAPLMPFSNCK